MIKCVITFGKYTKSLEDIKRILRLDSFDKKITDIIDSDTDYGVRVVNQRDELVYQIEFMEVVDDEANSEGEESSQDDD